MVQYTFEYFPVRGRGEFIRYIFAYVGVPYEEISIDVAEWKEGGRKTKTPFGVLPRLLVDGKSLSQSCSIGRYLAEKHSSGLAGNTDWNKAQADMLVHFIEDIYPKGYVKIVFGHLTKNDKEKMEAWETFREEIIKPLFDNFEKTLGKEKWFCGDITWADLYIAELTNRVEECFQKGFLDNYPHLKQHTQRVHELPNIKRYVEKRPQMFI